MGLVLRSVAVLNSLKIKPQIVVAENEVTLDA